MADLEKDSDSDSDIDIVTKVEIVHKAERSKKRKFTRIGLPLVVVGIVFIAVGLPLNTGPASLEGFFVGVGIVILISGIISLLIALINPFLSDAVRRKRKPQPTESSEVDNI